VFGGEGVTKKVLALSACVVRQCCIVKHGSTVVVDVSSAGAAAPIVHYHHHPPPRLSVLWGQLSPEYKRFGQFLTGTQHNRRQVGGWGVLSGSAGICNVGGGWGVDGCVARGG